MNTISESRNCFYGENWSIRKSATIATTHASSAEAAPTHFILGELRRENDPTKLCHSSQAIGQSTIKKKKKKNWSMATDCLCDDSKDIFEEEMC